MLNIFYLLGPYPEPFILLISKNEVKAIDLLTVDTKNVVGGLNSSYSMAIDIVDMKLYFENNTNIARSRLDGTDTEVVSKKAEPWDMTIDWIRRRIYWTQYSKKSIWFASLNGKDKGVLKGTKYRPEYIAVDPIVG